MKESEFLREFEEILEADAGSLNAEARLAELDQWNSLAVISLIAMADDRVGLTLSARSIQGCTTVRDLMGLLGDSITPT